MTNHGPACLRVPVTVRVSPDAAGDLPTADLRSVVADAVAAACGRFPLAALGLRAADVTDVAVRVRPCPTGPDVPQGLLDAAAGGALDGAARAGFRSGPSPRRPVRVAEPPSEPFDPTRVRYHPTGTTYVVPFFDGGTAEVPLRDATGARPTPWLPLAGEVVTVAQAIEIAWRWHVYRHGRWAIDRELPGYNGLVRLPDGVVARCFVFLTDVRALAPDGAPLPGSFTYRVDLDGGWYEMIVIGFREPGRGTAGLYRGPGGATGSWPLVGGDVVPIVFVTQPLSVDPAARRDPDGDGRDAGLPQPSGAGQAGGAGGAAGAGGQGDGILPPGGSGDALSGAGGTRAKLDVLDPENAPHGRRSGWPSPPPESHPLADLLGLTRDLGVCEPFFIEPDVSALVDVRSLAGRMRALAAALGIPECGYLGTFAIHAASVISLHARGVGIAGSRSTIRTDVTVRTDASGNNGYVDVRPGASPDLEWLKSLAGLARELSTFVDDVIDTYGYSQNVGKVGVSENLLPYYGGWILRFRREFGPLMTRGYESIFAETCRLLLLQQLRSSADGIAGRRDPAQFPRVLEDLRMKLDIIGDVVLWPQVLLDTIDHAGRVYMSSGSVREVLSVEETVMYDEISTTLPAPIESAPRRVLERVGEGRLERRGRERVIVLDSVTYTADTLRDMINKRRAVLNASDPLFLQVPDLERLVAISQDDPNGLERYLRGLLAEMADANAKMTEKATDVEDGAYFALEASQYVKREGGRDSRGLRYTLQGIHQLADDLLRPHARDDWYYGQGVNEAIDHKADSDFLLAIASSIGIIVLGLLCAPLGAVAAAAITGAAGIAFAVHDVLDAQRQTDLYRALEDPELFEHWQDVQLAQLMAAVSVAFAVFDVVSVGKAAHVLASEAVGALRIAEKQGARTAFRLAAADARERVLKGLTEEVMARAVREAVMQGVIVGVMNELLPHVITPVLVPWIRQQAQEHGTFAEVDDALGPLATTGGTQ